MNSYYVCQLPQKIQTSIRRHLKSWFLREYGSAESVQEYCGMTLDEAVQMGMDSRISDLEYQLGEHVPCSIEESENWER